jgi:hypothetical protein
MGRQEEILEQRALLALLEGTARAEAYELSSTLYLFRGT